MPTYEAKATLKTSKTKNVQETEKRILRRISGKDGETRIRNDNINKKIV